MSGLPLLAPVESKLRRADMHAQEVVSKVTTWTSSTALSVSCDLLEERLGYRVTLAEFPEPPLMEWGLIVGDCVHNLRSALDNLAFALSRLRLDPPANPWPIAFPIYQDSALFEKRGRKRLTQMSCEAASLVERLQPFQRDGSPEMREPNADALVLLQWLNNADKHAVPPLVLLPQQTVEHTAAIEFQDEEHAERNTPPDQTIWAGPLVPGVVLFEHRTIDPIVKVTGKFEVVAFVGVEAPAAAGYQPVGQTVSLLAYYVRLVVDQFRHFFE